MNIQAVIFDVYTTLLEVGPPPSDAEARWQGLFEEHLQTEPPMSRSGFAIACSQVIAVRHAWARSRGIAWPEIHWPSVMIEVVPALGGLREAARDEFVYEHIQLGRTLRLPAEAAATLSWLGRRGVPIGIASNSQAYTLRELEEGLAGHGLNLEVFFTDLCFWSFRHGFSKPDPHVFQFLTHRLAARGISPETVLMVGDRLDNDIRPARAFGWQTWQIAPADGGPRCGPWTSLLQFLRENESLAA